MLDFNNMRYDARRWDEIAQESADLDRDLHGFARSAAERLESPNRKHLRFNDIVDTAKTFYPHCPFLGVLELVEACDRADEILYADEPMWKVLREQYAWILPIAQ